jgi:hypothetical protein
VTETSSFNIIVKYSYNSIVYYSIV